MNKEQKEERYLQVITRLLYLIMVLIVTICILLYVYLFGVPQFFKPAHNTAKTDTTGSATTVVAETFWQAPDTSALASETNAEQIRYGRELIANTAVYFGPKGKIRASSNGMNCQNCHLNAGTKIFGNNYGSVAANYPKFRERSGTIENLYKRVNDCFERSLNGESLDTNSKEMQAISAYILWLGSKVPKGEKAKGSGLVELNYMDRAADPQKGKPLFANKCVSCHGEHGEGKMNQDGLTYQYPPLWGDHSYNIGAGLYRISRFAGYIKANMPLGATYDNPQLSDEESWDIAAYVNTLSRPSHDLSKDWPKIAGKPVDHPYGPYADAFTAEQHKYGPFEPIAEWKKKNSNK